MYLDLEGKDLHLEKDEEAKDPDLPKLSNLGHYIDTTNFSTSPETARCLADYLQTEVPHIDYLKYRKYHNSQKRGQKKRSQSDTPCLNFFYVPQVIRVAPRSTVKVFANFPIPGHWKKAQEWKVTGSKKKKIWKGFGDGPIILPELKKKLEKPKFDIQPALTYGEKLWKLHELACQDFKVK